MNFITSLRKEALNLRNIWECSQQSVSFSAFRFSPIPFLITALPSAYFLSLPCSQFSLPSYTAKQETLSTILHGRFSELFTSRFLLRSSHGFLSPMYSEDTSRT